MSRKNTVLLLFVLVWVALFAASYLMSTRIDGPRNMDTGLRRLDVLARYQMVAFAVAVVSAILGIVWRRDGKRVILLGFMPLILTILAISGLVAATLIFNPRLSPEEAYQPPQPTAPAVEVLPQD